ncbi:MAG: hypothetical protein ACJA2S_000699 [Cyclobacteriaceae bacterium]|jgi:hypothetical protein
MKALIITILLILIFFSSVMAQDMKDLKFFIRSNLKDYKKIESYGKFRLVGIWNVQHSIRMFLN